MLAASIALMDGVLRIEGYDDAFYGETVHVNINTYGNTNPYDDKVSVALYSQRGDVIPPAFNLWKQVNGQYVKNITSISYHAHAGNDVFFNHTSILATAFGGAGNDELYSTSTGINNFFGDDGDDILRGGDGNDYLSGGAGRDYLDGGNGNDQLTGGLGDDTCIGGAGLDTLFEYGDVNFVLTNSNLTGMGTDTLTGLEKATLQGGAGNNILDASAFSGPVTLHGFDGNDTLRGGSNADFLYGGNGSDLLTGNGGNDRIDGGTGFDILMEAGDVDFILTNTRLTGLGTDTLFSIDHAHLTGGASANRIDASAFTTGNVQLHGLGGNDVLHGGTGIDTLLGGEGDDVLYGGAGTDYLYGENGRDTLFGGDGDDYLNGGDDLFVDDLWGGTGSDTFYNYSFYSLGTRNRQQDKIWDWTTGEQVYFG